MDANFILFSAVAQMAKSALLGGASFLLGAPGPARAEGPAASQATLNVREFGATGDGKTDDTKAIQRALDAAGEVRGAVFVAPGVYLCADLQMRPNTALVGVPDLGLSRTRRNGSAARGWCGQVPPQHCGGLGRHD